MNAILTASGGHVSHLKDAVAFFGLGELAGEWGDLVIALVE